MEENKSEKLIPKEGYSLTVARLVLIFHIPAWFAVIPQLSDVVCFFTPIFSTLMVFLLAYPIFEHENDISVDLIEVTGLLIQIISILIFAIFMIAAGGA